MKEDIFEQLSDKIEQNSFWFGKKTSGEEIEFLKTLFSKEEAEIYVNLTTDLDTVEQIADRAKQDTGKVADILEKMALKGLAFPKREGDSRYYAAAPFAHGILEQQIFKPKNEFKKFVGDLSAYLFAENISNEDDDDSDTFEMPLRTIPIKTSLNISRPVAPYEDVLEIIKKQDRIAITECTCLKIQEELLEETIDQPREVCLILGFYADYYVEHGWGRKISKEEALEILKKSEEAGLVHQIPDCEDPGAICNCGPNSCGQIQMLSVMPDAAKFVKTNYFAEVDHEMCTGCETCIERCPIMALSITSEDVAEIDIEKCIGCGLCVGTCPADALILVSKEDEERQDPGETCDFMRSSKDIEGSISQ